MAVFDELSSYAFVVKDSTCRFGVSVYLSTEILHTIPAGKDVIIVAKANKVGKTLGFATMEMFDRNGLLLARGEHIKHLPMGHIWDFTAKLLLSPFILPIILKYGTTIDRFKVKAKIRNIHENILTSIDFLSRLLLLSIDKFLFSNTRSVIRTIVS